MAPSSRAVKAAIASITRVNEVRAMERWKIVSKVRTSASGRLGFTDHTASWTSSRNCGVPTRGERTA